MPSTASAGSCAGKPRSVGVLQRPLTGLGVPESTLPNEQEESKMGNIHENCREECAICKALEDAEAALDKTEQLLAEMLYCWKATS